MSIKNFLSMLVLLYAALVPAGIWVKAEIKSSIRDALEAGTLVAKRDLDIRDSELRDEMSDQLADGLGPVVSYIASVDDRLTRVAKLSSTTPRPQLISRERAKDRGRTWEWVFPKR